MASTAWYRSGTIALAQNSTTITGTGTQWNNPVYGVAPGQMLLVPGAGTVVMYEIQRVASDTQITLATPYTGSAATGQQYAIVTALVGSVADFSRQLSVLVNQWQSQLDGWQQILSSTGDVKLTAPDGSTVTVKSQAALTAAINDTLNKTTTTTQTVASAVEFKKNITSNGDQQIRATSTTPNLLLRFRDVNDTEKGAVFCDTSTGQMNVRWNGSAFSVLFKPDGTVTFPSAVYSGSTPLLKTGDYGLGSYTPVAYADTNTLGVNQFIKIAPGTPNMPTPTTAAWAGISWGYDGGSRAQLLSQQGQNLNNLVFRVSAPGAVWSNYSTLWHSTNTTVDSNGFIKKASPIIRLSNDPEKMAADYLSGFTLAGVGAVNGEAAGVTAQRLATGIYQITGSLGLATEGWQIEIPQDANGNRLVFASTEMDEDGTIRVCTHKRQFDPESAMVVAGVPMDIPEGRWIDLRLSMPAQPEPVVNAESITDDNAE